MSFKSKEKQNNDNQFKSYTKKIVNFFVNYNDDLKKCYNKISYFNHANEDYIGVNEFGNIKLAKQLFQYFENGKFKHMQTWRKQHLEQAFLCNIDNYDVNTIHFMIMTYTIFHEVGHGVQLQRFADKREADINTIFLKIIRMNLNRQSKFMKKNYPPELMSTMKSSLYHNAITERFANQYAIKTIQQLIKDNIIDLNDITKNLK